MPQGNRSPQPSSPGSQSRRVRDLRSLAFLILALVAFWLVFSGKFDLLHLGYGALSVVLVTVMCRGLLVGPADRPANEVFGRIRWSRALVYPWWLLWQILVSNLLVAAMILRPRLVVKPVLLQFRSGLQSDLARLTLGNSMTLTPGTLTLQVVDDVFLVHALDRSLAAGLLDGSMQHQVAVVFGEPVLPLEQMEILVIEDAAAWLEGQP